MKVKKVKVLIVDTPNAVGKLAEVAGALADAGVNIQGISAYEKGRRGVFVIWPYSPAKAKKALAKVKCKVEEDSALLLEVANRVGVLKAVAERVAASGINVQYVFAVALQKGEAGVIIKTSEDARAAKLIRCVK